MSRSATTRASTRPGRVTVVIPSWNGRSHLEICLDALQSQQDPGCPWNVAVFDNASDDGTRKWLRRRHPGVRVLESSRNVGFAAACNRLVESTDADAVALLNNDTCPDEGWLRALVRAIEDAPDDVIGVAGKVLDWTGDHLDFAGGVVTFDGHAFQRDFGRRLSSARMASDGAELLFGSGSNLLVRREPFLEIGGFDEGYFAYLEDVDFGWRAWSAGHRILFAADATVRHRGAATSDRLGNARRGFLFERNAFLTAYKNYDSELWPEISPAILMTLISRAGSSVDVDGATHRSLSEDRRPDGGAMDPGASRGLRRRLLDGIGLRPSLDAEAEAHLRALVHIVGGLDRFAGLRATVQARRVRTDSEILERFPPHVVPTYRGDAALFATDTFRGWLPRGVRFVHAELGDIMERP